MDMKPTMKKEDGFTLLELLIAMFILSFGLLGTATMLSTGIGTDRLAQMITVEGALGSSVVEEITSRDSNDAVFNSSVTGAAYDLDPDTSATTKKVSGRTYSATYSVSVNNPVAGVSRVDVTVSSGARTVSFTAFKGTV
ncbi:MAG: prepilin-type N-terminal cleavage/methylation domain-containing protein [Deltaproteobacteria bacterium]|nr:prepilin-type N-terminal cleavage/methylation domain-containing protein [Deltaproteobacteria bacterium]